MDPIVATRALTKSYRFGGQDIAVLRGLDFEAERGSFTAITGRSGTGKSTLLHILGGLDRASAGSYRFGGCEMAHLSDDARAHLRATRIGFVFQSFHLLPHLSILENVAMPFLYSPEPREDAGPRAAAALDRVGLAHRVHHRPNELSGGEMQRAAIARAIVMEPDLLLADEPTGNLDAQTGAEVLDTLEHLNAGGATLILVTHDPDVARRAPRRATLQHGRLDG